MEKMFSSIKTHKKEKRIMVADGDGYYHVCLYVASGSLTSITHAVQ